MKAGVRAPMALALLSAILFAGRPAAAQVTTGNIDGIVKDAQGATLRGVAVVAANASTGTTYQRVTEPSGRFQFLELPVGGPYTVTATLSGFKDAVEQGVLVALGSSRTIEFTLELSARQEAVEVVASAPEIDFAQAGSAASISNQQMNSVPTIARSIFDVVQANPYFSGYITSGNAQQSISIAGRNNRYNSIQIDGAVNNDIFGLSATGTPEGQANSQPISFDAIQEAQLLVSPYDVREGGFSGGGLNIVTRSGTNLFSGDGFFYGTNQNWVGQYFNPTTYDSKTGVLGGESALSPPFTNKQGGGSVGGPIAKNRAFFFFTTDSEREQTPSGVAVDGTSPNFNGSSAAVAQVISILQNQYGYNPAGSSGIDPEGQFNKLTNNDKTFARVDMNLSPNERLTVRNNYVNSLADSGSPSPNVFMLPDDYVRFRILTDSTVGQLTSTLGGSTVNEFRVAGTAVRNRRGGEPFEQEPFPKTTVTISPGITVVAGRDNSSTANQLFQNDIEVNDDLTSVHGSHTLSIGTHDEFFHFQNLFIQNTFGNYSFTSSTSNGIPNLMAGLAQSYSYNFSNTGNPLQQADFRVAQFGAYAGDQWRAGPGVTITAGVRVDLPRFNHTPNPNPLTVTDFDLATNIVPAPTQFSPRVGFGWDPTGGGRQQIRGGAGIFSGRTPYVWISNQYSNNGIDFSAISITTNSNNKIPYDVDASTQPTDPTGGTVGVTKQTINLISPNFKFPSELRGNLGWDMSLPWGMTGSAEVLYNKTLEDIQYQNLNVEPTGASTLDGRPLFRAVYPTVGPTLLLTNTTEGYGWSVVYDLRRAFRNKFGFEASYFYGQQKTPEESESSVALTSWEDIYAPNPNNPPLTTSDFDPGQRVTANLSYEVPLFSGLSGIVSLLYTGQSGHPYTLSYSADANGDGQSFNDNMFLPTSTTPLTYTANGAPTTYASLQTLFDSLGTCATDQIGQIFQRNSCRAPWINSLDMRFAVRLPYKRAKVDLTLDMLNVLNMLSNTWGTVRYANFNQIDVVQPILTNGQVTGMNLTTLNPIPTGAPGVVSGAFSPFSIDDVRSRWQMQFGARVSF